MRQEVNIFSNTPAHVVPYLSLHSSRALSKVFEHRSFVAHYPKQINQSCAMLLLL